MVSAGSRKQPNQNISQRSSRAIHRQSRSRRPCGATRIKSLPKPVVAHEAIGHPLASVACIECQRQRTEGQASANTPCPARRGGGSYHGYDPKSGDAIRIDASSHLQLRGVGPRRVNCFACVSNRLRGNANEDGPTARDAQFERTYSAGMHSRLQSECGRRRERWIVLTT
jgi:hypothetical protein